MPTDPPDEALRTADRSRRPALAALAAPAPLLVLLAVATGCLGNYRFGASSLYRPDIRTVYVPVFESDSFRRNLGERLTEAVVRQIEMDSPYKVIASHDADSVLRGQLVSETKRVLIEDINDFPRDIEVEFVVQVSWLDRSGNPLMQRAQITPEINLGRTAHLIPEAGMSVATAQQQAIDKLAEQIVAQMELPW